MILIRKETKVIKNIIKCKYPNIKFSIRYKTVKNYVDSSDKIVIKLYDADYVDDIIKLIREHVEHISVFRTGDVASMNGDFNAKIANSNYSEYIEPDLLEFIEVGQVGRS